MQRPSNCWPALVMHVAWSWTSTARRSRRWMICVPSPASAMPGMPEALSLSSCSTTRHLQQWCVSSTDGPGGVRAVRIHRPDLSDAFSQLTGAALDAEWAHHDEQCGCSRPAFDRPDASGDAGKPVRSRSPGHHGPSACAGAETDDPARIDDATAARACAHLLGRDAPHSAVRYDRRCRVGNQHRASARERTARSAGGDPTLARACR